MASIDITPLSFFFSIFALAYLVALLYVLIFERRHDCVELDATDQVFSLIVPAHNEESVIAACLDALFGLDYSRDQVEILVVDDASTDRTARIVSEYAERFPGRVAMLQVPIAEGGRGKATALNRAFRFLNESSRFREDAKWIIGIFDGDGEPDANMLKKASAQFRSLTVAGVQATVRIRNRAVSWLTRMQDIEFAGFSRVTQIIRMRISHSAALGGNGQFVRASALRTVAINLEEGVFWQPDSLTEDLDLSTRLVLQNWDLHHLSSSSVWQEGVETTKSLMNQRTRWAWGSLQVFVEYVLRLRILKTPDVRLGKRLDLLFNLSMFLVSPLVLVTWILSAVAFLGLIQIVASFPTAMMVLVSFGYLPFVGYGLLTVGGYRKARILLDLVGFAIYTYHWVPCLYVAMWRLLSRTGPVWLKTAREGEIAAS